MIADNMPRDPDEGEAGTFSEELWSRQSASTKVKKNTYLKYSKLSALQVTHSGFCDKNLKVLEADLEVSESFVQFQ